MSTILEEIEGVEVAKEAAVGLENVSRETLEANTRQGFDGSRFMEFLKRPTGEGDISFYVNHPLNYDGSKEMGQVIRGCTGLLGALDFAVLDIGLGMMKILSKRNMAKASEGAANVSY